MIHIITAANRALYRRQLDEMHRMRWRFYIEERGWSELRDMQVEQGVERDEYDDERAVYIVGIDDAGAVAGSMRLRPTDDHSLLADRFFHLLDDPLSFEPSPETWEITRIVRRPESRSKDYALRFAMNAAMLEMVLSRGVKKLVATADTFLVPPTRALWRHKFRPLGLPTPYDEGEMIALEFDADAESLRMVREAAGFFAPQMLEIPAPLPERAPDPVLAERLQRRIADLTPERMAQLVATLEAEIPMRQEITP